MDIKKEIADLEERTKSIRQEIRNMMESLPENENIKVLSDKPTCFIMNSKHLETNHWESEYYSFRTQYEKILEILDQTKLDRIFHKLTEAVQTGNFTIDRFHKIKLHPQVVKNLKKAIGYKEDAQEKIR